MAEAQVSNLHIKRIPRQKTTTPFFRETLIFRKIQKLLLQKTFKLRAPLGFNPPVFPMDICTDC